MIDWKFAVTIGISIVLGITTIVFAIKGAKKKKPAWARYTTRIIGLGTNAPPELKLIFGSNPVSDVYRTIFTFLNKGYESIRKDDVTNSIALHFKGAQILREPIIKAISKGEIQFSVRRVVENGDSAAEVSFLYLDHNDGAVIEVLHTKSHEIKLSGNIIGAKEIAEVKEYKPLRPPFWKVPSAVVDFVKFSVLFSFAIYMFFIMKDADSVLKWAGPLFIFIVSLSYLYMAFWPSVPRFPKWSHFKE